MVLEVVTVKMSHYLAIRTVSMEVNILVSLAVHIFCKWCEGEKHNKGKTCREDKKYNEWGKNRLATSSHVDPVVGFATT